MYSKFIFSMSVSLIVVLLQACEPLVPTEYTVVLSGSEEVPSVNTFGTGNANIKIYQSGIVKGDVTLSGFTSTAVHLHSAFAGENGLPLFTFEQSSVDPNQYIVPADTKISSTHVDLSLNGGLYVNAHSAAFPDGEVRAQLLPAGVTVVSVAMNGKKVKPTSTGSKAAGETTFTLNANNNKVFAVMNVSGMLAIGAHLHSGANNAVGPVLANFTQDVNDANVWLMPLKAYSAENFGLISGGGAYVDAASATFPEGEIRGNL